MRPLGAPDWESGEQPKSSTTNHSNFTNKISGGAGSVLPGIGSETDRKAALNERSYRANRADRATGFPVGAPAGPRRAEEAVQQNWKMRGPGGPRYEGFVFLRDPSSFLIL